MPGSQGPTWCVDYALSEFDTSRYGLWLRTDGFVVDALEYFSFNKKLCSTVAFEVAARGGWYSDQWNNEIIRTQKSPPLLFSSESPQVLSSYLPPLNLKCTGSWQHVTSHETPEDLPALKAWKAAVLKGLVKEQLYFSVHQRMSTLAFFMNRNGTRILVPTPQSFEQESDYGAFVLDPVTEPSKNEQWFLYIDEDCLFAPIHIERSGGIANFRLRIFRAGSPSNLRRQDWGLVSIARSPVDGEIELAEKPYALPGEKSVMIPDWLEQRIRNACLSAIATLAQNTNAAAPFPDCRIEMAIGSFPDGNDRKSVVSNFAFASDGPAAKHGQEIEVPQSRSLRDIVSVNRKVYGWWGFDPSSTTLFNTETGQSVSLSKTDEAPIPGLRSWVGKRQWWQLTYKDAETTYSISVARNIPELHMTVPFFYQPVLPYGLWRRVHIAIVDALLCWPKQNEFGHRIGSVGCIGGWADGRWHNNLSIRSLSSRSALTNDPLTGIQLPSLNAASPAGWEFVDTAGASEGAWLSGLSWERQTGVYTTNQEDFFSGARQSLSGTAEQPFSGFQKRVPYLRRKDGSAVFFPARVESTVAADIRGEFPMYTSKIACIYADQDFSAVFVQNDMTHLRFDIHKASLNPQNYFHLHSLTEQQRLRHRRDHLELPDWQQWIAIREKVADLGLPWRGSNVCLHDDPERVARLESGFPRGWGGMQVPEPKVLGPCVTSEFCGLYRGGLYEPESRQIAGFFDSRELPGSQRR